MSPGTLDLAAQLGEEIGAAIDAAGAPRPEVALVLGSGLGAFAAGLEDGVEIDFEGLPSMPASTVPGHAGRFVVGRVGGTPTICQSGRVHLYEGWDAEVVTRAVRSFAVLGARAVVLTNAAGGLMADWPVPCLMRISDHLNMQGVTPLQGSERATACPYDPRVAAALAAAAAEAGVALREGTYVGLRGPSYETAAEIRMLQGLGAQAVGMSTVLEVTAGWSAGLAVGAVSCITNPGAGIAAAPLNHEEVVEAGRAVADDFAAMLTVAVPKIAGSVAV